MGENRNYGLIFYQSLILFTSYRFGFGEQFEYELELEQVGIDGILNAEGTEDNLWEWVCLSKHNSRDRFFFRNGELDGICGGLFTSAHVEIVEMFGRVIRFSLVRGPNQWWINCLFAEQRSSELFFQDIRRRQRSECGKVYKLDKFLQYQLYDPQNEADRLRRLGPSSAVYLKNANSYSNGHPKTINFATYQNQTPSLNVYLVLQSMTFNMSRVVNTNVYILCATDVVTHKFILKFSSIRTSRYFFTNSSVEYDLNPEIPCPTDWVTTRILQQVYSL